VIETLDLELPAGAMIVVESKVSSDDPVETLEYSLLPGAHTVTDAAALGSLRSTLGDAVRSMLHGGLHLPEVMQFHDVSPGTFTVCAESRGKGDVALGPLGLACARVDVRETDDVIELELSPTSVPRP